MSSQADALAHNRGDSLARRPAGANLATPGRANPQQDGRRLLTNASRLAIARIKPDPDQPRRTFGGEADERLAESLRVRGQLVPVLVRWSADAECYVVIDGERRYRAAVAVGLADLKVVVEDEADPDEILEMQLVANGLREDVSPIEQAEAWRRLMTSLKLTQRELADKLGYTVATVNRQVALLNLPADVQADVGAGRLGADSGYYVSRLDGPAEQRELAGRIVADGMTRDEVKAEVERRRPTARVKAKADAKGKGVKAKAPPVTSRRFRQPGGMVIEVTRARGLDVLAIIEAFRSIVADLEASQAAEADTAA